MSQPYTLTIYISGGVPTRLYRDSTQESGAATGLLFSSQQTGSVTVYEGDVLRVNYNENRTIWSYQACRLADGTLLSNGGTFSFSPAAVTSNNKITVTGQVNSFTLNISTSGSGGAELWAERTKSPYAGQSLGYLSNGAKIYYGDVIKMSLSAYSGYDVTTYTINGTASTPGQVYTKTVTGSISVYFAAKLKSSRLCVYKSTSGVTVTVLRTSSPNGNAATGVISDGSVLYYGDKLTVSYSVSTGYTLRESLVNGQDFATQTSITVTDSDVVVRIYVDASGHIYINNEPYLVYIGNGSTFDRYITKIGDGSSFVDY